MTLNRTHLALTYPHIFPQCGIMKKRKKPTEHGINHFGWSDWNKSGPGNFRVPFLPSSPKKESAKSLVSLGVEYAFLAPSAVSPPLSPPGEAQPGRGINRHLAASCPNPLLSLFKMDKPLLLGLSILFGCIRSESLGLVVGVVYPG